MRFNNLVNDVLDVRCTRADVGSNGSRTVKIANPRTGRPTGRVLWIRRGVSRRQTYAGGGNAADRRGHRFTVWSAGVPEEFVITAACRRKAPEPLLFGRAGRF